MSTVKDYIKSIGITLVTTITILVSTGAFNYPQKVENEIKLAKKESIEYTDKEIMKHEEKEAVRDEMLIKYLDQRFDDMEKLINSKR